jgi:trehalose 2-sulfotransferase
MYQASPGFLRTHERLTGGARSVTGGTMTGPGRLRAPLAPRRPALHATSAYVVCTNPRSGSWLFSEGLGATGVAGHPREWFNVIEEQQQRARWGLAGPGDASPLSYLAHVVGQGSTPNGVFGLKLHYYQLADLSAQLARVDGFRGLPVEEAISAAFPEVRYIWLTRRDKARQAISYYRACQSEIWWQIESDEPGGSGSTDAPEPVFDAAEIARLERLVAANDAKWQGFFARCGIDPLVITYEELGADYAGTISRVLSWLGVAEPDPSQIRPPRLRRQADELSEAWLVRYAAVKAQPRGFRGGRIATGLASGLGQGPKRGSRATRGRPRPWRSRRRRRGCRRTPGQHQRTAAQDRGRDQLAGPGHPGPAPNG